jgi:hypothetical protein
MQRIAVAIVHGIEINDPDFADTPTKLLLDAFTDALGSTQPAAEEALVIEPIHWAPHAQDRQQELFTQVYGQDSTRFFDEEITDTVKKLNAGSTRELWPLIGSLLRPTIGDLEELHWPTARWLMMHFVGDVIAYDGANYEAVHATFARGLANLAKRAGPHAPLCVIAHSFGTVLASDYFYDQQHPRRKLASQAVNAARGTSLLAKGHTLAWLYTMGSPLALWSLRYSPGKKKMSKPIAFPGRKTAERYPTLATEWVNIYEKDDIIAYPLRVLSEEYADTVSEDREVEVGDRPVTWTPLTHSFYWSDRRVMDPIGAALANGWEQIN